MINEVSHLFVGPLAELSDALHINSCPTNPLLEFLVSDRFEMSLARFSRRWPDSDPKATATQWSKTYFSTLIPATLVPTILMSWRFPLDPGLIGLRLSEDGAVRGFELPHAGHQVQAGINHSPRYDVLVDGHLRPVIDAISSATQLPKKVLWSNAGNVLENTVQRAIAFAGPAHPAIDEAMSLVRERRNPDGRTNPLFEPVRYEGVGQEMKRMRRVCCLRYFTPSLGYCKSCPLAD
jgi:ferric iron reductase protein FhuF